MATISTYAKGNSVAEGDVGRSAQPVFLENILDYTRLAAGATDTVDFLNLAPGTVVLATGAEVVTADSAGNSGTVKLRITTTDRGTAQTVATAGSLANLLNGTLAQVGSTATTINLLGATGTINAIIRVWAWVLPIARRGGAAGGPAGTGSVFRALT